MSIHRIVLESSKMHVKIGENVSLLKTQISKKVSKLAAYFFPLKCSFGCCWNCCRMSEIFFKPDFSRHNRKQQQRRQHEQQQQHQQQPPPLLLLIWPLYLFNLLFPQFMLRESFKKHFWTKIFFPKNVSFDSFCWPC